MCCVDLPLKVAPNLSTRDWVRALCPILKALCSCSTSY